MFCLGIIYRNYGILQDPFTSALSLTLSLLSSSPRSRQDIINKFCPLGVDGGYNICAVIHGDLGSIFKDAVYMPIICIIVLSLYGKDLKCHDPLPGKQQHHPGCLADLKRKATHLLLQLFKVIIRFAVSDVT